MSTDSHAPSSPTAQILGLKDLAPTDHPGAAKVMTQTNPLHQVKTKLTVKVGSAELTVGELLGAKEHQVIRLDHTLDQPVDILLEGQVVARGTLVAVDDYFGVRITELPISLKS